MRIRLVTSFLLFGLILSAATFLYQVYKFDQKDLITTISFRTDDKPWTAGNFNAIPISGAHYFGDFQFFLASSMQTNPYSGELGAQYTPLGKYLLLPLSIFQHLAGFVIFILFTVLLMIISTIILVRHVNPETHKFDIINIFLLSQILTLPFLTDFDRGNLYSISIAALSLGIVYYLKGKTYQSLFWFLIGIAFKPYLVIVFLIMLNRKTFIQWGKILSGLIIVNVLALFTFSGKFLDNIYLFVNNNLRYGEEWGFGQIMHSGSFAGSLVRILEQLKGFEFAKDFTISNLDNLKIFTLISILISYFIWHNINLPFYFRFLVLTSLISLAQPASFAYSWGWVGVSLAIFAFEKKEYELDSRNHIFIYLIFCLVALTPLWITRLPFYTFSRPLPQHLFVAIVFAFLIVKPLIQSIKVKQ
jgi:hypothetical protein